MSFKPIIPIVFQKYIRKITKIIIYFNHYMPSSHKNQAFEDFLCLGTTFGVRFDLSVYLSNSVTIFGANVWYTNGPVTSEGLAAMVISYERLWDILKVRKITKKELAKRAGISDSTLRVMTRGGNVSLEVLGKICGALRVDLGDIASFVDV